MILVRTIISFSLSFRMNNFIEDLRRTQRNKQIHRQKEDYLQKEETTFPLPTILQLDPCVLSSAPLIFEPHIRSIYQHQNPHPHHFTRSLDIDTVKRWCTLQSNPEKGKRIKKAICCEMMKKKKEKASPVGGWNDDEGMMATGRESGTQAKKIARRLFSGGIFIGWAPFCLLRVAG